MLNEQLTNRLDEKEVQAKIESFKADISYPHFRAPENINTVISDVVNLVKLRKACIRDILEYNIILNSYSLFLASQESRLKAYIGWCESNCKFIVGQNIDKSPGYGFDEKNTYLRANMKELQELENKKLLAQTKADYISFITNKIYALVESLKDLRFEMLREIKNETSR